MAVHPRAYYYETGVNPSDFAFEKAASRVTKHPSSTAHISRVESNRVDAETLLFDLF